MNNIAIVLCKPFFGNFILIVKNINLKNISDRYNLDQLNLANTPMNKLNIDEIESIFGRSFKAVLWMDDFLR